MFSAAHLGLGENIWGAGSDINMYVRKKLKKNFNCT